MENPVHEYWKIRLNDVKKSLEGNNFEVFLAETTTEALRIFFDDIVTPTGAKTFSWGGTLTMRATGVHEELLKDRSKTVLNPDDPEMSPDQRLERRRESLLVDMYLMGCNALVDTGQLVNLDAIGNRVGALMFGPKYVVVFVGRNKIVSSLDGAMERIKEYVAPANCLRLDKKTPCAKTGLCEDCASPDRICNYWAITEKSFPKGRIKVILINQDLGF